MRVEVIGLGAMGSGILELVFKYSSRFFLNRTLVKRY